MELGCRPQSVVRVEFVRPCSHVKAVESEREEQGDHDLCNRSPLEVDDETDESKLPQPVQTGRRIVGMQTSDAM